MDTIWPVDLLHVLTLLVIQEVNVDSVAVAALAKIFAPHRFEQ